MMSRVFRKSSELICMSSCQWISKISNRCMRKRSIEPCFHELNNSSSISNISKYHRRSHPCFQSKYDAAEVWLWWLFTMFCVQILLCLQLISLGLCELWCYSCVSSQPGCEEFYLDWRIHHAITCPREDDKCVKLIERKGAEKFITRDCLSNLEGQKKDIPADRYDGCRTAATQPKLAVYVENHISQLEIKNQYWDEVTYCFCEFDQWCNSSSYCSSKVIVVLIGIICVLFFQF